MLRILDEVKSKCGNFAGKIIAEEAYVSVRRFKVRLDSNRFDLAYAWFWAGELEKC